jgi:hypothetical protein
MGQTRPHFSTLFFSAIFSRYPAAIEWGRGELEKIKGPVALASPVFDFRETKFYDASMGSDVQKQLFVFDAPFDPAELADLKIKTNALEETFRLQNQFAESRPINIDPGYLSEAKLVLATTKDRDHRIYLRDGIYAEVTLFYLRTGWEFSRWTYPDYRRADVHDFLNAARLLLREKIQADARQKSPPGIE